MPSRQGKWPAYWAARIARDYPEIHARLEAGEFPSVRQAAIAAGILNPTLSIPSDPVAAARALRRHFAGDSYRALIRALRSAPED